ncbi:hypothetical protein D3C86_1934230 [compost metagenome]
MVIFVYLFQEVKESPEFLAAVQKASNTKPTTTVVAQKKLDVPPSESFSRNSGNRKKRSASSRERLNQSDSSSAQSPPQSQTQNNTQPHTRSHAS